MTLHVANRWNGTRKVVAGSRYLGRADRTPAGIACYWKTHLRLRCRNCQLVAPHGCQIMQPSCQRRLLCLSSHPFRSHHFASTPIHGWNECQYCALIPRISMRTNQSGGADSNEMDCLQATYSSIPLNRMYSVLVGRTVVTVSRHVSCNKQSSFTNCKRGGLKTAARVGRSPCL